MVSGVDLTIEGTNSKVYQLNFSMKWFQHDTDTESDVKIRLLKKKHGLIGKSIYFEINRLIAKDIDANKPVLEWGYLSEDFIKHPDFLMEELGFDDLYKINEVLIYCIEIKLLYFVKNKIANPRLLKRGDNYLAKIAGRKKASLEDLYNNLQKEVEQTSDSVHTLFEECSDTVRTNKIKGNNIDKITRDKIMENENLATPFVQENSSIGSILANMPLPVRTTSGITHKWQDDAIRYANELNINLTALDKVVDKNGKNPGWRGRWFKIFKEAHEDKAKNISLMNTYSNLADYSKWKTMSDESRILLFFWVFNGNDRETLIT